MDLLGHRQPHLTRAVSKGTIEGATLADTRETEEPLRGFLGPPVSQQPFSSPGHSPAGAILVEHSPWGQLPNQLFISQAEAPGQGALGTGAGSRGHTCATVQQLRQTDSVLLGSSSLATSPPACFPHVGVGTQQQYPPAPQGSHIQAGRVAAHRRHQAAGASRALGRRWHRC